jgi:hypothetical protein
VPLASPPWTRRRRRARRRRGGARGGKQAAGKWIWAHPRSIGGGGSAGEVTGERRRRRRCGATTGARAAVRKGAVLNNVLHRKLPCGLGKMLGRCLGSEDRRRSELVGGGPCGSAWSPSDSGRFSGAQGSAQGLVGVRASTEGRFASGGANGRTTELG